MKVAEITSGLSDELRVDWPEDMGNCCMGFCLGLSERRCELVPSFTEN